MSDGAGDAAAPPPAAATAGRLLRDAREKQGLHIAALAAAIKVAPKKLELLESDRFDELPDATFTRALAQTVCRALKTDPAPVMRLLPPPAGHRLEQVGGGLNAPFRERPGLLVQRDWMLLAGNPVSWLVAVIVVATVTIYFLPASVTSLAMGRPAPASAPPARGSVEPGMPPEPADGGASATPVAGASMAASSGSQSNGPSATPGTTSTGGTETAMADAVPAGQRPASAAATPTPAAATVASVVAPSPAGLPPGMLQLQASAASWIEVTDGRGKSLVSRLVQPGEAIGVDGVPPLKLRIGNAAGTQVLFRGQPTELQAFTRDNVARLELK